MKIRRGFIPSIDQFTIIPNHWARDPNLSRRAIGLLVELLSHSEGWDVTVNSLWRNGTEGKNAIVATLKELEQAGYLRREQTREGDRFGAMEYIITDPSDSERGPVSQESGDVIPESRLQGHEKQGSREQVTRNGDTKKNNQKDQPQEHQEKKNNAPATRDATDRFDEFWATYPRRQGKGAAVKAWAKAIKRANPDTILKAAAGYRDDPHRDPQFTAHPSTWLNQDRWEDEPLPAPSSPGSSGRGYDPSDWLGQDTRPTIEGEVVGQMEIGR